MALILRNNRDLWDPFRDLWDLQREMNRVFSTFGGVLTPRNDRGMVEGTWAMSLDLYETKDQLTVKAELPGFKPEDIDISVLGNILTIQAERKHDAEVKDEQFYRRELAYGTFRRQLELPQAVSAEGLKATYKNGVLEIAIPKREEARPQQIKVQVP